MTARRLGVTDGCFHGGAFFEAVGERFDDLDRRHGIINADVLDAWFPPAPGVTEAIEQHLEWLARTSPPTNCGGLREAIAEARGVPEASVLVGAGSSDLIYLAFREWLTPASRVLLLDPCYGEYAHVLEQVVGCHVDRFTLSREQGWAPDLNALGRELARGYDFVVIVNPNNPTGNYLSAAALQSLLTAVPARTKVWIDEAYLEYVAGASSLERFAAGRDNVVVCKSMSKVYALSGMRVAYLVASPRVVDALRRLTPPWAVGLPSQVAAVRALEAPVYYAARYRDTVALRIRFEAQLARLSNVVETTGNANFILVHLDPAGPPAATVIERCRADGVYLRDVANMGRSFDAHVLRTAVKDPDRNAVIVSALARASSGTTPFTPRLVTVPAPRRAAPHARDR